MVESEEVHQRRMIIVVADNILDRLADNAAPEVVVPNAVYKYACEQRMVAAGDVLSETQPAAAGCRVRLRCIGPGSKRMRSCTRENSELFWLNFSLWIHWVTPVEDESLRRSFR